MAVPAGTPGASHTGDPNYISVSLTPFLAALKSMNPACKIIFITSIARSSDPVLNGKFIDVTNYVIANRAAMGIDIVIDSRTFVKYSPATPTVSGNPNWYQNDNIHMTPAGYIDRVFGLPRASLRL